MKKSKGILGQWKISKYYTNKITIKDIDKAFKKYINNGIKIQRISKANKTI